MNILVLMRLKEQYSKQSCLTVLASERHHIILLHSHEASQLHLFQLLPMLHHEEA